MGRILLISTQEMSRISRLQHSQRCLTTKKVESGVKATFHWVLEISSKGSRGHHLKTMKKSGKSPDLHSALNVLQGSFLLREKTPISG